MWADPVCEGVQEGSRKRKRGRTTESSVIPRAMGKTREKMSNSDSAGAAWVKVRSPTVSSCKQILVSKVSLERRGRTHENSRIHRERLQVDLLRQFDERSLSTPSYANDIPIDGRSSSDRSCDSMIVLPAFEQRLEHLVVRWKVHRDPAVLLLTGDDGPTEGLERHASRRGGSEDSVRGSECRMAAQWDFLWDDERSAGFVRREGCWLTVVGVKKRTW